MIKARMSVAGEYNQSKKSVINDVTFQRAGKMLESIYLKYGK